LHGFTYVHKTIGYKFLDMSTPFPNQIIKMPKVKLNISRYERTLYRCLGTRHQERLSKSDVSTSSCTYNSTIHSWSSISSQLSSLSCTTFRFPTAKCNSIKSINKLCFRSFLHMLTDILQKYSLIYVTSPNVAWNKESRFPLLQNYKFPFMSLLRKEYAR